MLKSVFVHRAAPRRAAQACAWGLCSVVAVSGCNKQGNSGAANASAPAGQSVPQAAGGNLIKNSSFNGGSYLPWSESFSAPAKGEASIENGALCLRIDDKGTNKWDAQLRHREMVIVQGHTYTIDFTAWADKPTRIRPKVGMSGDPYDEYWIAPSDVLDIGPGPQRFVGNFTMSKADDATAEFAFHLGGRLIPDSTALPLTVCIDNISLTDPQFIAQGGASSDPPPNVLVNQVGYLPKLSKRATVRTDSTDPLTFEVVDSSGAVVKTGETFVIGEDPASGDHVHVADFSDVTKEGSGYLVRVGKDQSYPFDIGAGLYRQMKYDALAYFYHNRSGIEIKMPFARQAQWERPAGHKPDVAACAPGIGCSYSLDVTGGWYDAGDHGKYVVNGGISVWTLLNLWERSVHLGTSSKDFGDGNLNLPESGNRVPDLLDEARWELEFLLRMQVPSGNDAGMVHHKIHDDSWTALALRPDQDPKKRYLRPVSTAATLNLAASAAQGSRIFKKYDVAFAKKLLDAAELAWKVARKNPERYAPASDKEGGGPYDDRDVSDEFYWAAAELYLTTGKSGYLDYFTRDAHHQKLDGKDGKSSAMTWARTDALGLISLATVPSRLSQAELKAARGRLTKIAEEYVNIISGQGYRVPFDPGGAGKYPWGSNSFVLNNMLVMAVAFDFTKDEKYLNGVAEGMDYLLGRNPMGQSYVTGHGEKPLLHPHHRFWARQYDTKFPPAPPGCVSGGPNSGLDDPYVKAAGLKGCAPQKCYLDHIEAWSTNEITINWNAPFAWVAAFLDEKSK